MKIQGEAHVGYGITVLARVADQEGTLLTSSSVAAIACTIYRVDADGSWESVDGWRAASLEPDDVIYDTLQTGGFWTEDATGYNFLAAIGYEGDAPFTELGTYRIEFALTLSTGLIVPVILDPVEAT